MFIRSKPTKELQAELKALCRRIVIDDYCSLESNYNRYEKLLVELYKRNEKPCALIINKYRNKTVLDLKNKNSKE